MTDKRAGADTNDFKMKLPPGAKPGKEFDERGNEIPLAQRTPEDQEAALLAGERGAAAANPKAESISAPPRNLRGNQAKPR
jgi:hypothetical protein